MTDYYNILGITESASQDEIKSAYRNLAKQWHPDLNKDNPDAEAKFKQINEANDTLSDPAIAALRRPMQRGCGKRRSPIWRASRRPRQGSGASWNAVWRVGPALPRLRASRARPLPPLLLRYRRRLPALHKAWSPPAR